MGPLNVHRVDTLVVAHYSRGVVLRPQGAKFLFLFMQFLDKGGDMDGCNWYWRDGMLCDRALTLRRLMSYIYIYIYIYIEHPFLMFLDHTQRRSTVGRTPLDE